MDSYHYQNQFSQLLGGSAVNIARAGSSNRRIVRTTVDYIEQNPVDFVVLGLTFYDRQESPLSNRLDPWVSYNNQGMQAVFADVADFDSVEQHRQLGEYILSRYRYDINEHYLEALYLDLRMFAAYLKQKGIKFCIFNTCDRHHNSVDLGAGFVPFTFIGNEYLEQNGSVCMEQDKDLPANARHHYGEDVIILVRYLVDCVKNV